MKTYRFKGDSYKAFRIDKVIEAWRYDEDGNEQTWAVLIPQRGTKGVLVDYDYILKYSPKKGDWFIDRGNGGHLSDDEYFREHFYRIRD